MIDLHTHVLPGIDDGPADEAAAVEFVASVAAQGTRALVATPHVRSDHPAVRPAELAVRVARLEWALTRAQIDVDIVAGGEVDLLWALDADDDALRQVSYGQQGTDLLLETPYGELPTVFDSFVDRLAARGYRILLAHPERSPTYQRDPRRILPLTSRGVLIQVTASALVSGRRGSRTRALAQALIREGIAHVIASDGHGAHVARAGLAEGAAAADELIPGSGRWFVEDAPAAILRGEPLPARPEPTRGMRRLRRRART
jgi:protein-tyrosine phosphatase